MFEVYKIFKEGCQGNCISLNAYCGHVVQIPLQLLPTTYIKRKPSGPW